MAKRLTSPQQRVIDVMLGKIEWKVLYTKASFYHRFGNSTPRLVTRASTNRARRQLAEMGLIKKGDKGLAVFTDKYLINYMK